MRKKERDGQGVVEYALILVLAVVAVVIALTVFGGQTANTMRNVSNRMGNVY